MNDLSLDIIQNCCDFRSDVDRLGAHTCADLGPFRGLLGVFTMPGRHTHDTFHDIIMMPTD
jgi:hypothetical protein